MEDYYKKKINGKGYRKNRIHKAYLVDQIIGKYIKNISKNAKIVDLGCGSGLIKNYLSKKYKRKIIGVEIDKSIVEYPKDVIIVNTAKLPFKKESVDLVICHNVYEHIEDREIFFKELSRILKKNGLAYFAVASRFYPKDPHYDLYFLSWLPKWLANIYVKIVRGNDCDYSDINFPVYWPLMKKIKKNKMKAKDITYDVAFGEEYSISDKYKKYRILSFLPKWFLSFLLKLFSQWFFIIKKT